MRRCLSLFLGVLFLLGMMQIGMCSTAEAADADWYWISSDNKYSKFYNPSTVKKVQFSGKVATMLTAVTKTSYSYGGAKETLDNYGITDIIPNSLSYSIATVQVCPQLRTLAYVEEAFYDKKGKLLWSKKSDPLKPREMNSLAFDEDFYAYIVDTAFGAGEVDRRAAKDRWLLLWQTAIASGGSVSCIADTTTMRVSGENMIFWEWQEYKDAKGNVSEIRFLKKAINIPQYTGKVVHYQHWDGKSGWQDYTDKETDGMYHAIVAGSLEEKELKKLSEYKLNHTKWVERYAIKEKE